MYNYHYQLAVQLRMSTLDVIYIIWGKKIRTQYTLEMTSSLNLKGYECMLAYGKKATGNEQSA